MRVAPVLGNGVKRLISNKQRRINMKRSKAAFPVSSHDVATHGPSCSGDPSRPLGGGLSDAGFDPKPPLGLLEIRHLAASCTMEAELSEGLDLASSKRPKRPTCLAQVTARFAAPTHRSV